MILRAMGIKSGKKKSTECSTDSGLDGGIAYYWFTTNTTLLIKSILIAP